MFTFHQGMWKKKGKRRKGKGKIKEIYLAGRKFCQCAEMHTFAYIICQAAINEKLAIEKGEGIEGSGIDSSELTKIEHLYFA